MKVDWKKTDKAYYRPKNAPERIRVPAFKYFTIEGAGDPNKKGFEECVGVLYSLAYAVRMSPKSGTAPEGYFEYTVFPLEGIWDISEEAKKGGFQGLDKDTLVYTLMIRQPDFVTNDYARFVFEQVGKKKPSPLLGKARFETIEDGDCVQMTHIGPYDAEPASFQRMEEFCAANSLARVSKLHREIYMSDPRKANPATMKTVLRFRVRAKG
jgi:hypothetical protein